MSACDRGCVKTRFLGGRAQSRVVNGRGRVRKIRGYVTPSNMLARCRCGMTFPHDLDPSRLLEPCDRMSALGVKRPSARGWLDRLLRAYARRSADLVVIPEATTYRQASGGGRGCSSLRANVLSPPSWTRLRGKPNFRSSEAGAVLSFESMGET